MDILYVVSNGKGANGQWWMAANLMPFDEWKA